MDLSKINPKEFFSKYLKLEHLTGDEYRALCPFHGDSGKPNLTINVVKGVYKCFACHESGNIVDFYKKHTGKSASQFAEEFDIPSVINFNMIDEYHDNLMRDTVALEEIKKDRGYTDEVFKHFKIGKDKYRVTIPIMDAYNVCTNIRRYDKLSKDDQRMISFKKGFGRNALFGIENLKENRIVICAGEWDRMKLWQYGIPAITPTAGEGSWNKHWNSLFKDKEIIIIFDCDKAGRHGAKRIADFIFENNKIKIIDLGLDKKGADIVDWFVEYKKTKNELESLIKETQWYIKSSDDYIDTVLSVASKSEFYDKKITFKGVVAGKDLSPYQIPKIIELQCDKAGTLQKCAGCSLSKNKGYCKIEIEDGETLLELIDISKSQKIGIIRQLINIPKCGYYYILKETMRNIEEIKIIPEIEFTDSEESEYVVRKAYLKSETIATNQTYVFFGTTLPDPKNQQTVHLLDKAVPSRDNIEQFKLDKAMSERLKIFQTGKKTIEEKLHEIYEDFSFNITHIYHREDLLASLDLVWHSALSFKFLKEEVPKGWVELFVLGDSRTGKSETAKHLLSHYRCGERISAENTSIAGLIAGLQQTQKRWTLMWGKIPLNDKRLLVIDEAGGLTNEDFSKLSSVRSEGIAEVIKIQIQKTKARARLVFMANPLKRRLMEYNYGILAVKEIIGQNEDIARFDFMLSVSDADVPVSEMNKRQTKEVEHVYTSDLCHDLVMFAWSRKSEDITFTEEAENKILEVSKEFAGIFSTTIPLVQGAEIRLKIAKLCVALAIRLFNVDPETSKVIVDVRFVDYIRIFLLKIYHKTGFDYYGYSQQRKKENNLSCDSYIREMIKDNLDLIELILDNNRYTKSDFATFFDVKKDEGDTIVNKLLLGRAIKKYSTTYVKTPAFISFLKLYKKEIEDSRNEEDSLI